MRIHEIDVTEMTTGIVTVHCAHMNMMTPLKKVLCIKYDDYIRPADMYMFKSSVQLIKADKYFFQFLLLLPILGTLFRWCAFDIVRRLQHWQLEIHLGLSLCEFRIFSSL